MHATAALVAIFTAVFVASFLPLIAFQAENKAEQDKSRARRMADARMNARLVRLNI